MNKLTILSLSTFLVFHGCEDTNTETNIESILLALLNSDEASGIDGFESSGDADLNHDVGLEVGPSGRFLSDTLSFGEGYRVRFGRRVIARDRSVEFVTGLDTSIGSVSYTISGVFIAKAVDTLDFQQIDSLSFEKDFTTTLNRKVRFVRTDDESNPDGYSWKIDAMTPLIGGVGEKVSISSLSFYLLSEENQEANLILSIDSDSAGDLFVSRDSLPSFTAFDRILVYASVQNSGPEYNIDTGNTGEWVFYNYGKNRIQRGRKQLNDSGMFFDQNANDNIYSGSVRVHGPGINRSRGIFRTFTEVVDLATIFVSDGGYNTSLISIPYRVERPE